MLKVLSWNIRQGGGSRMAQITNVLKKADAQIVVLSEFHNNKSGVQLRTNLLRLGYRYQVASSAPASTNTAFIASKLPCNSVIFENIDPEYSHDIVRADFKAFRVYGMYLPHKKKHRLFDFLTKEELKNKPPAILAGDFNTGKNYIDQAGNSFWYTDELEELEELGYADAFRHKYPDAKEFSWYSHQGNGYRYDQTYVAEDLLPLVSDCYYNHEARENKISDHSPMILELG